MTLQQWLVKLQQQFNENGYEEFLVTEEDFKDAYNSGVTPEDAYTNYMLALEYAIDEPSCEEEPDSNCDDFCGC